ncbi:hypothetical protein Hanom_Chr02g00122641 [Helianthus anomalus]
MSRMKMARYKTFWIRMRKDKPLDESRKTGQTSFRRKCHFTQKKKTSELNYTDDPSGMFIKQV